MINSDYFHKIAVDLFEKKKLNESKDACYVILKKQPNDLFANELIGLIYALEENIFLALFYLDKALLLSPRNERIKNNLFKINSKFNLDKNSINDKAYLYFNKSDFEKAFYFFSKSLSIDRNQSHILSNAGLCLLELKKFDEAISFLKESLKINPLQVEALYNLGLIQLSINDKLKAFQNISLASNLKKDIDHLNGNLSFLKKSLIDWSDYDPFHQSILNKISYCDNVIQPFNFLSVSDSLELQLKVSQDWSFRRCPPSFITSNFSLSSKPKIRIGYFSSDFRHHPVSYLIIELLELHNRDQFEIFGFSLSPLSPSGSDSFLQRLDDSFDHIFDVSQFSDLSIVEFVKSHEIDIAVDLNGHTQDARTNIFAQRLAPIQINYLGYPGTMGSNYYDFLIADIQTIPTQSVRFYSENIIYLPELFQVFDTKRVVNKKLTRLSLGLPEDAIIFCCFNNNYKFSPIIFNSWIEILKGVKNSVLWLLADNQTAATNLKNEFLKTDLDSHRLIICYRTGYEEYLSRYCVADLFLDTFPFNAGTTANDCLWMGLPILTYAGESFASRMASSLLKACNIPELITYSINDYIEKGIKLGNNPNQIREYKKYLTDQKQKKQLWDMKKQTKNIELGYIECFKQYQKNKKLEEIIIKNE